MEHNGSGTAELTAPTSGRATHATQPAARRRRGPANADDVRLHYQPIVDLVTGRVLGFEALARWEHPSEGLLPAGEFIPLAERTGSIARIGAGLLERACHDALGWTTSAERRVGVSVNVSARQLVTDDLERTVWRALGRTGLDPSLLTIEVTETAAVGDAAEWTSAIESVRARGVQVLIDDFGTGYSLDSLRRLPVDGFKIDRSFVVGLDDPSGDPTSTAIVSTMMTLARALHLDVIAEGIETPAQRDRLVSMGCRRGQGYLFARPMPAAEVLSHLEGRVPGPGRFPPAAGPGRPARAPTGAPPG